MEIITGIFKNGKRYKIEVVSGMHWGFKGWANWDEESQSFIHFIEPDFAISVSVNFCNVLDFE